MDGHRGGISQGTNGFVALQAQVSADRGPAKADDLDFFFIPLRFLWWQDGMEW